MANQTYRDKGAIQTQNNLVLQSDNSTHVDKGAMNAQGVAVGGATGKSNPLYGCLGGCLQGPIG